MRALISLYHQAEDFITPENLSQEIDNAFAFKLTSTAIAPEREKRFEVVYNLLSIRHGGRIRVKTYTNETDAVPSAVPVYRGADWYVASALIVVDSH